MIIILVSLVLLIISVFTIMVLVFVAVTIVIIIAMTAGSENACLLRTQRCRLIGECRGLSFNQPLIQRSPVFTISGCPVSSEECCSLLRPCSRFSAFSMPRSGAYFWSPPLGCTSVKPFAGSCARGAILGAAGGPVKGPLPARRQSTWRLSWIGCSYHLQGVAKVANLGGGRPSSSLCRQPADVQPEVECDCPLRPRPVHFGSLLRDELTVAMMMSIVSSEDSCGVGYLLVIPPHTIMHFCRTT